MLTEIKRGELAKIESPKRIWPVISSNDKINKVVWANISEQQRKHTPPYIFQPMVYIGCEEVEDDWMQMKMHKFFSASGGFLYLRAEDFKHLEKIQ